MEERPETVVTNDKEDTFDKLFSSVSFQNASKMQNHTGCRMEESWVKRPETVVTNEKEAARMMKLVRPRWKRSDLVLQVRFWWVGLHVESALSLLTISYHQRISPLCSNHSWVAYNLNNCEERLLIQTLPRFYFCTIFITIMIIFSPAEIRWKK